jgi:cytochrome c oxidase subunit 4
MSNEHHDTHEGHANDGAVHVHDTKLYYGIFFTLMVLTVVTVLASLVDIDGFIRPGTPHGTGGINFLLAMAIATFKAACVVTWFMHLKDDKRFNALIFIGSLLFVGVFFVYTGNDTYYRQHEDRFQGVMVHPSTGERAPGGLLVDGQSCANPRTGEGVAAYCLSYNCVEGVCAPAVHHEEGGEHGEAAHEGAAEEAHEGAAEGAPAH